MSRRTWLKLYANKTLRGSLSQELEPAERWVWIGFLCLAADSPGGDGVICISEGIGFSDRQLAAILNVSLRVLKSARAKCAQYEKIRIDDNGIITVLNWQKYQNEYQRQKKYRQSSNPPSHTLPPKNTDIDIEGEREVTPQSYNSKLQNGGEENGKAFQALPFDAQREIFKLRQQRRECENSLEKVQKAPSKMLVYGDGSRKKESDFAHEIEKIDERIQSIYEDCR